MSPPFASYCFTARIRPRKSGLVRGGAASVAAERRVNWAIEEKGEGRTHFHGPQNYADIVAYPEGFGAFGCHVQWDGRCGSGHLSLAKIPSRPQIVGVVLRGSKLDKYRKTRLYGVKQNVLEDPEDGVKD